MKIRFWGVRGSTPTPEHRNSFYGGNTACIEVRLADDTLIILDCGSGFRALGKSLLGEYRDGPIHAYVFLTHFHWDHIQGIPFFLPLYKKGNTFLFHSATQQGSELQAAIEGQMANPYFPVDMSVMGAIRHFYALDHAPIQVSGAVLSSAPLNHPQGCVGYRIEAEGGVFVLATDTEPGSPVHDRSVRELAQGADVLVYDAQYTPQQLEGEKKGWGHSSWLEAARIARDSKAKRLILFHHDPDSDDMFVDGLVRRAQQAFPNSLGAAEGLVIDLPSGEMTYGFREGSDRRTEHRYRVELPVRLEWREQTGTAKEAQGVTQDISKSGIYFIAHETLDLHQEVELELVLPDAITHRGDLALRFAAQPVRQESVSEAGSAPAPRLGVAARLNVPEKKT